MTSMPQGSRAEAPMLNTPWDTYSSGRGAEGRGREPTNGSGKTATGFRRAGEQEMRRRNRRWARCCSTTAVACRRTSRRPSSGCRIRRSRRHARSVLRRRDLRGQHGREQSYVEAAVVSQSRRNRRTRSPHNAFSPNSMLRDAALPRTRPRPSSGIVAPPRGHRDAQAALTRRG